MSDTPKTDALREVVIGQYKENELTGNGMASILAALANVETLERERDNALSDAKQADTDSIRALAERNEAREKLAVERALADRLAEILQRIANEDYRGNRPHHCAVADYGVKAWKEARND